MKILMVLTSRFYRNGITSTVMNYYKELIKYEDVSIDFVLPNDPPKDIRDEIETNGSEIFILPMSLRRKRPVEYANKLKKLLSANKYDIVHVHGSSSLMFLELYCAERARVKVRIAHCHSTMTKHPILHRALKPLFDKSYTDAFACGKKAGKWLFEKKKFYLVPNAQKVDKFLFDSNARRTYRTKYGLNDKIVLGHVGGFSYEKNHIFMIKLLNDLIKENDNYRLVLIGGGKLEKKIRRQVDKSKLNDYVIFVGSTTEVNKWLNALDIMLLPSRYEGLPNVLIESQINGLPCIASDNVTTEAKLTGLVTFEELHEKLWEKRILSIKPGRRDDENNILLVQKAGYDVEKNAEVLHDKYRQISARPLAMES